MPSLDLLHEYVGRLAQAMESLISEDTPPVVESMSPEHFSVTYNGRSKLFDVFFTQSENDDVNVEFYHRATPILEAKPTTNEYWAADRIVKFLERKYICVLKVPDFEIFNIPSPYERQQLEFRCVSIDSFINRFMGDAESNSQKTTQRLQQIDEGIDQKIRDAKKQIENLESVKSKIREFTTQSARLIEVLKALDQKLSDIRATSPPDVET